MSFLIDHDVKDRVRNAVDIVDLVGSYLQLRRQGANYVGLCPFHEDRRPSFNVNPNKQTWKCWVCDLGGDVFSFLMQKERINFPEALQMLAERVGIEVQRQTKGNHGLSSDEKKILYDAMAWACKEYCQTLKTSKEAEQARKYLEDRGISQESIDRFQIGFAPDTWSWLLESGIQRGFKPEVLESIGLLAQSDRGTRYDRFRGRVLFPIRDPQGRPISIGGRILPGANSDQAKYVNCNETKLYHKNSVLYGLDTARESIQKENAAIVMEGYTDVIMANQFGVLNAVAACGTALGENHIRLLRRYTDKVILLLDGDAAGQRRTNEILELFIVAQMDLRIATLPNNLDPCDFLLEHGANPLKEIIQSSSDALDHKIRSECQGFDPIQDTHRANQALERILSLLAKAPRSSMANAQAHKLKQDQILMRLSRIFGVATTTLQERLEALRPKPNGLRMLSDSNRTRSTISETASISTSSNNHYSASSNPSIGANRTEEPRLSYSAISALNRELFEIIVLHPELIPFALERFPTTWFTSQPAIQLWALYQELEMKGHSLEFSAVLSVVEDSQIKNLLVTLEEEASRKKDFVQIDPNERLHALCERFAEHDELLQSQQRVQQLESKRLGEDEELDLLQQVLAQAKTRKGFFPLG